MTESYLKEIGFQRSLTAKGGFKMRRGRNLRAALLGASRRKNYPLELRVVAQGREVCVRLRADAQHGLQLDGAFERLQRRLDRAEARACGRQRVVRVGSFGVALEGALEHLLRGDEVSAVQLDDAAVVERVGVARQRRLRAQARFGDGQIGARACRHLGDARVLLDERAEEVARRPEMAGSELLVCSLEGL